MKFSLYLPLKYPLLGLLLAIKNCPSVPSGQLQIVLWIHPSFHCTGANLELTSVACRCFKYCTAKNFKTFKTLITSLQTITKNWDRKMISYGHSTEKTGFSS